MNNLESNPTLRTYQNIKTKIEKHEIEEEKKIQTVEKIKRNNRADSQIRKKYGSITQTKVCLHLAHFLVWKRKRCIPDIDTIK